MNIAFTHEERSFRQELRRFLRDNVSPATQRTGYRRPWSVQR